MPSYAYLNGASPLYNALMGAIPSPIFSTREVEGDEHPFNEAPVGTVCYCVPEEYHVQVWVKVEDNKHQRDWVLEKGMVHRHLTLADFTDGGSATGTVVLGPTIPNGALVQRTFARVGVAFDATSTATIQVGDGDDVDRYNTGTPSVATTGVKDMGAPSGTAFHATAEDALTVTITEDDDFTDMTTGMVTVTIHYIM